MGEQLSDADKAALLAWTARKGEPFEETFDLAPTGQDMQVAFDRYVNYHKWVLASLLGSVALPCL